MAIIFSLFNVKKILEGSKNDKAISEGGNIFLYVYFLNMQEFMHVIVKKKKIDLRGSKKQNKIPEY